MRTALSRLTTEHSTQAPTWQPFFAPRFSLEDARYLAAETGSFRVKLGEGGQAKLFVVGRRDAGGLDVVVHKDFELPAHALKQESQLKEMREFAEGGGLGEFSVIKTRSHDGATLKLELVEGRSVADLRYAYPERAAALDARFNEALRIAARDLRRSGFEPYIESFNGHDTLFFSRRRKLTKASFERNGKFDWSIEAVNTVVDAKTGRFVVIDPD